MTARAAIIATLASLATGAACSERESPPAPSPWVRTMTIAERRAWVTRCSGAAEVSIFEGRDFAWYSAESQMRTPLLDGRNLERRLWCHLQWDPQRGRLDGLSVAISVPKDQGLDETLVAPYVELVLAEMAPVARDAALSTRWGGGFAYGCVDARSREFSVSCENDESNGRWGWRFSVQAK